MYIRNTVINTKKNQKEKNLYFCYKYSTKNANGKGKIKKQRNKALSQFGCTNNYSSICSGGQSFTCCQMCRGPTQYFKQKIGFNKYLFLTRCSK